MPGEQARERLDSFTSVRGLYDVLSFQIQELVEPEGAVGKASEYLLDLECTFCSVGKYCNA